jgi:hypothetical protein
VAIQKKSLINNRTATKKALAVKPEVTPQTPARLATNRLATNRLATNRLATNRLATNRLATNRLATNRLATSK